MYAGVAVLAAGLGAAATVGLNSGAAAPSTGVSSHQVPGPGNDVGTTGRGTLNKAHVAAKVEPGVVDIDAAIAYSGGTSSEGTGMVLSADGLVLTNNHVIDGARTINVTLATTGKVFHATVAGYDATHDVALLRLNGAARLKVVQVGNSAQVTVGTPVLALGNAEGQGGTPALAEGIINSLNKTISPTDESTGATETLHGMLQTNADIVSGDSGGPLANSAGQVIGMDTANASSSQGSSSVLGYAIPINTALAVARQIAAGQASATVQIGLPGFLGVLVPQSGSASPQQQAQQQRQQIQQQQQSAGPGRPAQQRQQRPARAEHGVHQRRLGHYGAVAHRARQLRRPGRRRALRHRGRGRRDRERRRDHHRQRPGDHHPGFADRADVRVPAGQQGDPPLGNAGRPAAEGHPRAERRASEVSRAAMVIYVTT